MDDKLFAILRGEHVSSGGDIFVRKISRYEDLWEEIRQNSPVPLGPSRSTFWDKWLESKQPSHIHFPSLPAQRSKIDKVMPVQPPVGAERSSSKPQPEPWLANISTAKPTSPQRWAGWNPMAKEYSSKPQPEPWLANISTAKPTSPQRWAGWNPMAKEYYPSSSLYAPSLGASPAETLTTNNTPSSSPESQQGTHAPIMNPTAVPPTAVLPTAAHLTAIPPTAVLPTAVPMTSVFMSAYPISPEEAVESASRGVLNAATVLANWWSEHPDAGPVRQVASQSIYDQEQQTRHQEELELRKRIEKEEAAMRARWGRPFYWQPR